MNEQEYKQTEYRKRRVKKLKKIILWFVCILLLYPMIASVYFQSTINHLQSQVNSLELQLDDVKKAIGTVAMKMAVSDEVEPEESKVIELVEDETLQINNGKAVYLTFDDGPSSVTEEILEILDTYHAKATFFVIGDKREELDDWYKEIINRGHSLGLHSYTHDYNLIYESPEAYEYDLEQLQDKILELTGTTTNIVRFPGGSSNSVTINNIDFYIEMLNRHEFTYYDWNISSGDASSSVTETPEEMAIRIASGIREMEQPIVLMHDASDKATTVEALALLLEELKDDQLIFLPITNDTEVVQHITNKIE